MFALLKDIKNKVHLGPILLDLATIMIPIAAWFAAQARLGRSSDHRLASETDTALAAVILFLLAAGRIQRVVMGNVSTAKKKEAMSIMVFVLLGVVGSSFLYYDALISHGATLSMVNESGFIKARSIAVYVALAVFLFTSIRSEYHEANRPQ